MARDTTTINYYIYCGRIYADTQDILRMFHRAFQDGGTIEVETLLRALENTFSDLERRRLDLDDGAVRPNARS